MSNFFKRGGLAVPNRSNSLTKTPARPWEQPEKLPRQPQVESDLSQLGQWCAATIAMMLARTDSDTEQE
jgi:hypothetical protein